MNGPTSDQTPPRPEPISAGTPRPLWSVMIPTYNCAALLRQTLASVLAQDPGPEIMHIEVVDDCSTKDDPEAVVREVGKGRVNFYRREKNGGNTSNFNACLMRSRGHLVHLLHGDDIVYPPFYRRIGEVAAAHPDIAAFFVRCYQIDSEGQIETLLWRANEFEKPTRDPGPRLPYLNIFQPPGVVVRRSFFEMHGGYLPCLWNSDWEMLFRVVTQGGALALNEPMAAYRVFPTNLSSHMVRIGVYVRDIVNIGEIFAKRLPDFDRRRFLHKASNDAFYLAERGRLNHDREQMESNLKVWREITPWPARVRRRFSRLLRSWLKLEIRFSADEQD
jgi:glycosyltransferase involved in cell wall biosynthesis